MIRRERYVKQNTVIHILLGVAVLVAITLLFFLLPYPKQLWQWILYVAIFFCLIAAAFSPSLINRWRKVPEPSSLSPADISFCILVTLAGCSLAFYGVLLNMWWLMTAGIMLPPLSFMFRNPRIKREDQKK